MDSAGRTQTVELEHWLTDLSDQQAGQLVAQDDLDQLAADQLLQTVEDAADYAGVESKVVEDWVEKGLVQTGDGAFIKYNLDVFMQSDGAPTAEEKRQQVRSIQELAMSLRTEQEKLTGVEGADGKGPADRSKEEPKNLNMDEVMNLLRQKQKSPR
jgi:V8-like Glu-specific endopeptidase